MFKKGDRVICVDDWNNSYNYPRKLRTVRKGSIYEVSDCYKGKVKLTDRGNLEYNCYRFCIMEKDMSEEFKWGDDVVVQGTVYKFVGVSPLCSSKGIVAIKGHDYPSLSATFDLCKIEKHVPKVKGMTFVTYGQHYVYEYIEGAEKGDIVKAPKSNSLVVAEIVEVEDVIKLDDSYKLYKLQK